MTTRAVAIAATGTPYEYDLDTARLVDEARAYVDQAQAESTLRTIP